MAIMAMSCVPWGMIAVFRAVFQNGGYNSCSCGMSFTSAPLFRSLRQRLQKLRREQRLACLFPDKQHERFQHPLIVIFVLTLPVLVPWSRCDARIYALNKRMGMDRAAAAAAAAARVQTLPCWWFWTSWIPYTCTLSLLTIWPDTALQTPQLRPSHRA